MPRNGAGVFSLAEPPFIPNTVISSSAMNSDLSDIAAAMTASLARDGQGGMTAVLPLFSTGFNYISDPNTGMRRSAVDTQEIYGGGAVLATLGPTEADFDVPLKQNGSLITFIGQVAISSLTNPPSLWLATGTTYLRSAYPALWTVAQAEIALGNTFYNNGDGSTTFGIASMDGRAAVGVDAGGTVLPGVATMGATTGDATKPIGQGNLPNVNLSASNVTITGRTVPSANIGRSSPVGMTFGGGATQIAEYDGTAQISDLPWEQTGAGGTVPLGGSGTPLNVVQPVRAFKYIVYAGA